MNYWAPYKIWYRSNDSNIRSKKFLLLSYFFLNIIWIYLYTFGNFMSFLEHIINAIRSINSNKLRTILSSLGIIIGVSSVIVLLAFGEWAQRNITSKIDALGTNLLTLSAGWTRQRSVGSASSAHWTNTNIFTLEDSDIISKIPNVKSVAPTVSTRKQVIFGANNTSTTIYGTTPSYFSVRNIEIAYGSALTDDDTTEWSKNIVLWSEVVNVLFTNKDDPIGASVRIGNGFYTIIGVTKTKWSSGFNNPDDAIYMPITTLQSRLSGTKYIASFSIMADAAENMETIKNNITASFMQKLGVKNISDIPFTVSSSAETLETVTSVTNTLKIFLWWIAAISLIVGGIGIMNIMLVSVSERTREIGIRRSIWALDRDIIFQFLAESCVLTILWWSIGVWLSFLIVSIVSGFGIAAYITLSSVILALSCSVSVGILFGLLPAYKAAQLKPIDALRSE